ncbi:peptidyl-prolyl cis-trans isomerase [Candidatus Endowatersipora endosymbiont of Watersipora subatra]|uniref:peptidyl-prolyl cis-trans isomerase n=1 Tax=Candidatus Endowatersipora endosymbiont of Watersipora subatra TaxID=3077946 RepID=UPI00312CB76F
MLEALRSFIGGWITKIILLFFLLSFCAWSLSGLVLNDPNQYTIGHVGDTNISREDFLFSYQRTLSMIEQKMGKTLTREQERSLGLEYHALSEVIASSVLDEFCRVNGLSISERTTARLLAENQAFQDSKGKFNAQRFKSAMLHARVNENDFLVHQNSIALRTQLTAALTSGKILPTAFEKALSSYLNEERKFSYVTITEQVVKHPNKPNDQILETYFEKEKKKYAAPELRKLSILSIQPEDFIHQQNVTDDSIKSYYHSHKADYETAEKRHVQQVTFPSLKTAETALKSLNSGLSFETMLRENNLKLSDVDVGVVEASQLPNMISKSAFNLEPGTVSSIIDGPFGPTIVRVAKVIPARVSIIELVKDSIRKKIALRRASDLMILIQENIEDMRAMGSSLEEAAEKNGLDVRVIEAVDRNGQDLNSEFIEGIPVFKDLLRKAFQANIREQFSPLNYGESGFVWYEVEEIIPAHDRKLNEVKEKVADDWRKKQILIAVSKKTNELKERLSKEDKFEIISIADELDIEVKQTGFLRRSDQEEGFPKTAVRVGFSKDIESVTIADGLDPGSKMIIIVAERKKWNSERNESLNHEITRAHQSAANDLITQMIGHLHSQYDVNYNLKSIEKVLKLGHRL